MATVDRFNYYKGFENASPIARLIYECERDNINQHASEDLKHISATLAMISDFEAFCLDPRYPVTLAEEADRREAGGL